jgi:hypothetical protein
MPAKIVLSGAVVVLCGFFMGMPFPIGMTLGESARSARILYWGINGFTSVCGSAVAVVCLIHFGFQATLLGAGACYLVALASLTKATLKSCHIP